LRCATWRTLISAFNQQHQFCSDRSCLQSCSCAAVKILRRRRRTRPHGSGGCGGPAQPDRPDRPDRPDDTRDASCDAARSTSGRPDGQQSAGGGAGGRDGDGGQGTGQQRQRRRPPNALTDAERAHVLQRCDRFVDMAPAHVWASAARKWRCNRAMSNPAK
jgi:hypothetical protein